MPVVVLGVTGCIGAYKACEVLRELQKHDVDVHVVMTQAAKQFVSPMTFEALSRHAVFHDQWALGENGEIRHISLADDADLLLVAPATANCLGKFARGIADDALSTLYLATRAPVLVAPAMNVNMFEHPAVQENLATLRGRGVGVVEPGEGYLACGWLGKGRLAEVEAIVEAALARLARARDLAGQTVLVTAGPTIEDLDPVRYVSNRSSGAMGYRRGRGGTRQGRPRRAGLGSDRAARAAGRHVRRGALRRRDAACGGGARRLGERRRGRGGGERLPPGAGEPGEAQEDRGTAAARAGAHARHPQGSGRGQGRAVAGRLRRRDGGRASPTRGASSRRRTWT